MAASLKDVDSLKRRFVIYAVICATIISAFSWIWQRPDWTVGLTAGFAAGICDNMIMLCAIAKGSRQEPAKAFVTMKKSMFVRIVFAIVLVLIALKAGINIPTLFIAFFLMHLFYLLFLVLNVRGKTKDRKE